MEERRVEYRQQPSPWGHTATAAAAITGGLALLGEKIGGDGGMLVGLLVGTAISIAAVLFWISRPIKPN